VTWPEIWLPTVTVEIALSVPVEEIATRMSPRSTVAVRQAPSSAAAWRCFHQKNRRQHAEHEDARDDGDDGKRPGRDAELRLDGFIRGGHLEGQSSVQTRRAAVR
jgi:hypothetical protein